jgi:hypothetical protein
LVTTLTEDCRSIDLVGLRLNYRRNVVLLKCWVEWNKLLCTYVKIKQRVDAQWMRSKGVIGNILKIFISNNRIRNDGGVCELVGLRSI